MPCRHRHMANHELSCVDNTLRKMTVDRGINTKFTIFLEQNIPSWLQPPPQQHISAKTVIAGRKDVATLRNLCIFRVPSVASPLEIDLGFAGTHLPHVFVLTFSVKWTPLSMECALTLCAGEEDIIPISIVSYIYDNRFF